jgi:hypothetical protein
MRISNLKWYARVRFFFYLKCCCVSCVSCVSAFVLFVNKCLHSFADIWYITMSFEDSGVEVPFTLDDNDGDETQDPQDDCLRGVNVTSNVELIAFLKKNDYTGFKKKLNLPTDLEDNDDLEIMTKLMDGKGSGGAKALFKNLFNFLCCLAGESIDPVPMTTTNQFINFNTKFVYWLSDLSMKEEFSSGILRYFPNRELPESFARYVETMQVVPTPKWVKTNGIERLGVEQQTQVKFGSIVKAHFDLCKREINGNANPLWIHPTKLPSGVSEYAYLYFIRKELWPQRALELAKNAAKAAYTRQKRKRTATTNADDSSESQVETPEARMQQYAFDPNWYPDWWLVFLYMGIPADNRCRDSFVSGKAVAVASLTDIRHLANKVNRKAIDEAVSNSSSSTPVSALTDDNRRQVDIVISQANPTPSILQVRREKISALRDAIATMKELGMSQTNDQYKGLLLQLLQEQQAVIAELVTPQTQPETFETPNI